MPDSTEIEIPVEKKRKYKRYIRLHGQEEKFWLVREGAKQTRVRDFEQNENSFLVKNARIVPGSLVVVEQGEGVSLDEVLNSEP